MGQRSSKVEFVSVGRCASPHAIDNRLKLSWKLLHSAVGSAKVTMSQGISRCCLPKPGVSCVGRPQARAVTALAISTGLHLVSQKYRCVLSKPMAGISLQCDRLPSCRRICVTPAMFAHS